jgi:radical SAM superfamily enzyme with C-terminal helix-hairpin-helix motif
MAGCETGSMQMKRTLIRYKTRPETTEQNQRLIEAVFAELESKAPEGIRYMALRLDDGSFVHFVESGEGENPLPAMDAFRAFQSGVRERCAELPQFSEATIVGNYRMLGER